MRERTHLPLPIPHPILTAVCLLILVFSASPLSSKMPLTVVCQTAEDCFRHALRAGKNPYPSAKTPIYQIAGMQTVQTQFPGTIWAKRAGVHLGMLLKDRNPDEAIQHFRTAVADFPVLDDYLNFWIAESLIVARRPREAALLLEKVANRHPQSRLKQKALFLAGHAWRDSEDCHSAVPLLRGALSRKSNFPHGAIALLEIGKCERKLKHAEAARQAFRELWWRYPTAPEAKVAQEFLTQLPIDGYRGPTLEERYKRALSFYKAAAFEETVLELRQYLNQVSKGKSYDEAQYQLGMAFVRLKQYDKAEIVFRRLAVSSSHRKGDANIWLARSYLRQGKGSQLIALQRQAKSRGISGNRQALIHIFSGVWLADHGKQKQAIQAFERASTVARSSSRRQDALWRISLMYYQREAYPEVLSTLKRLLRIAKAGDRRAGAQYWMARTYEHVQQPSKAQPIYQDLAKNLPFTYYGQLAQARLGQPVTERNQGKIWNVARGDSDRVSRGLVNNLRYRKAIELVELGFFEEAQGELSALPSKVISSRNNLSHLISVAQQAGAYDLGIRLAIRHFGQKLKKAQLPRSSEVWMGAYPTGYVSMIQRFAPSRVDPYLIAGLIREESLYDTRAMSQVGARGLMQLMPTTASRVARRLGLQSPKHEELFNAEVNIQLGTTYVGQLLDQFNGNVVHTVAAYNAGPGAVKRWIAQYPNLSSDEFVERIAYRETRKYVKRVLGSYRIYRGLASSPCQAASLDRMC